MAEAGQLTTRRTHEPTASAKMITNQSWCVERPTPSPSQGMFQTRRLTV